MKKLLLGIVVGLAVVFGLYQLCVRFSVQQSVPQKEEAAVETREDTDRNTPAFARPRQDDSPAPETVEALAQFGLPGTNLTKLTTTAQPLPPIVVADHRSKK